MKIWKIDLQLHNTFGLKDKNGKEIYEGDILEYSFGYGLDLEHFIVHQSINGWGLRRIEKPRNQKSFRFVNTMIVIGNVWENPELLKEE